MPKSNFMDFATGFLNPLTKNGRKRWSGLLHGTPEKRENVSTLRPEQEGLYNQAINAGMGEGAGGAFGTSADYYRNLLSDNSADYNAFSAPELRRFNEQIIPDISEQFAGMGAGGLSSSGFQNAAIGAGTDLSERLGAIRANLRQGAAQGLQNIGEIGLRNYSQNMVTQPGSEGLLGAVAPAVGTAIGAYAGGPAGAAAGNAAGQGISNWFKGSQSGNSVGANRSPYGSSQNIPASPQMSQNRGNFQLPNFMQR